jgi:hypothetical protein
MAKTMRIDVLRSAVEAAGVAMAPSADQFDGEPASPVVSAAAIPEAGMDAGNYSRSWARTLEAAPAVRAAPAETNGSLWQWLAGRLPTLHSA